MKNIDTIVVISIIAVIIGLIGVRFVYNETTNEAKSSTAKPNPDEASISTQKSALVEDPNSVANLGGIEDTVVVEEKEPEVIPEPDPITLEEEINLDELKNSGIVEDNMEITKMTVDQKLKLPQPAMEIDVNKTYVATMDTSMGTIVLKLDAQNKPVTVNNFVALANMGFYDDIIFHRVIDGFMIQGGDPLGTGTGGPAYKFQDEVSAPNSNSTGTIAMANAGPGTNGSQFFINQADNNFLDGKHTSFGTVTKGMDVVNAIAKVQKGPTDKPVTDVVIKSVTISAE